MNQWRKWIAPLVLLLGIAALRGQEPAKPICGAYVTQPQPYVNVLQISCIDFTALRRVAPGVVWPEKPQTQVLVHLAGPGAVRIKLGEQTRWDEAIKDPYGHWVVLLAFDGIDHTSVSITPYKAIE